MTAVYRTLLLGFWLLMVDAGHADDRRPLREARSENDRYRLRVDPGHPGRGEALRPRATLFERPAEKGRERPVWRARLVNDRSPGYAFIRNDGRFVVTLDEFRRGGAAHALVIYNQRGKLLREFGLRELLRGDDWKHVTLERKAVKWLDGARFTFVDDPPQFVVDLRWKRQVRIDLEKLERVGSEAKPQPAHEDLSAVVPPEILTLLQGQDPASNVDGRSQSGGGEGELEIAAEMLREVASVLGVELDPSALVDSASDQAGHASEAPPANAEAEAASGPPADAEPEAQIVAEESAGVSEAGEDPQPQFAGNSAEAGWAVPMPDPKNPVDYVAWVMEQTVTEGPSAVPLYRAAMEQCYEFDGDWDVVEAAMCGDPEALALPEIAAYIEMHRDALANYHAAPQYEYHGMPEPGDYGMVVDILLPSLSKVRHLAKLSIVQAKYLEANGRTDEALEGYVNTLAVGAQLSHGTTLIDNLVGNAIQGLAADRLLDSLASPAGADVDYTRLTEQFKERYRPLQPMAVPFQGERACCLDMIQRLYRWVPETREYAVSEDGLQLIASALGGFDPESGLADTTELRGAADRIGFENMVAEANHYYDAITEATRMPYQDSRRAWSELEAQVDSPEFKQHNPLLAGLLPSLSRADQLAVRATAIRNGTRLVANLHAYRQQHGTYPESLDVFGDSDMTTDPFTGDRFVYRSGGDGFTLYSLGGNGVDDGGVHDPRADTNDVVYWPRQKK